MASGPQGDVASGPLGEVASASNLSGPKVLFQPRTSASKASSYRASSASVAASLSLEPYELRLQTLTLGSGVWFSRAGSGSILSLLSTDTVGCEK